jgi:hypothetical protein
MGWTLTGWKFRTLHKMVFKFTLPLKEKKGLLKIINICLHLRGGLIHRGD